MIFLLKSFRIFSVVLKPSMIPLLVAEISPSAVFVTDVQRSAEELGILVVGFEILNIVISSTYVKVSRDLESCIFFVKKNIVGPQEAQYPQFLLQLPLTHYILRSIFFRTHSTPPICLKTQKCAILSTFLESGGKNHPKVGVRREKFNIGNCPQIFFRASYICWELTI